MSEKMKKPKLTDTVDLCRCLEWDIRVEELLVLLEENNIPRTAMLRVCGYDDLFLVWSQTIGEKEYERRLAAYRKEYTEWDNKRKAKLREAEESRMRTEAQERRMLKKLKDKYEQA